jgi:hypothetical protein
MAKDQSRAQVEMLSKEVDALEVAYRKALNAHFRNRETTSSHAVGVARRQWCAAASRLVDLRR